MYIFVVRVIFAVSLYCSSRLFSVIRDLYNSGLNEINVNVAYIKTAIPNNNQSVYLLPKPSAFPWKLKCIGIVSGKVDKVKAINTAIVNRDNIEIASQILSYLSRVIFMSKCLLSTEFSQPLLVITY